MGKEKNENEEKKKSIFKKWWFWVIAIIIIWEIASSGWNSEQTKPASTNTNGSEQQKIEYMAIDIDKLEEALENNAAAAKDTYNGKYLEITGRLGTIDSDLKYISLLSTTDDWDLVGVHCTIKNNEQKEAVKKLSKDDTIIVKGKITDVGEVLGYYLDIDEISKK